MRRAFILAFALTVVPLRADAAAPRRDADALMPLPTVVVRSAERPAAVAGLVSLEPLGDTPGFWLARARDAASAPSLARALNAQAGVQAWPEKARTPHLRSVDDPLFPDQWHHRNTGQRLGSLAGIDANTDEAWTRATGRGVRISVVDDGVEHAHEDLRDNYVAATSFDWCHGDGDPTPDPIGNHGTSVAGVAAARGNNGIGVAGAAYEATISAQLLLGCGLSDSRVARALGAHDAELHISTNSWGPSDNGTTVERPGLATRFAMEDNIAEGRGGLGTVYVWANGNGRGRGDDGNYDGYTNLRYVVSVGAVAYDGRYASYAEPCACMLVAAPSNSGGTDPPSPVPLSGITTTDRTILGYDVTSPYTHDFGGTSSAAPLAAGIVALVLEANPSLSWRDVQHVLATTARRDGLQDGRWVANGAGHVVSHEFGFGLIDAGAAVRAAETWVSLPPERSAAIAGGPLLVPDGTGAYPSPGPAASETVAIADDLTVERAALTFSTKSARRGDLRLVVTSPSGTASTLLPGRSADNAVSSYTGWTATSTHFLGENAAGAWRVDAYDTRAGGAPVEVKDFTLTLHGH